MKILHVLDHSIPNHSGYSYRTRSILKQQKLLGYVTDHVTGLRHEGCECAEENVGGYHFYRTTDSNAVLGRIPVLRHLEVVNSLYKRLSFVVRKFSPDILHAHSPCLVGVAAVRAGRRYRIPVVYEMRASWEDAAVDHGTVKPNDLRYRLSRALETHVLRSANAVTTICRGLKNEILSRGVGDEQIAVIPNAVDIEKFRPCPVRDESLTREYGLEGKPVIGYIGSLIHYEGLHLLIDALPELLKARPDLKVLLVGDGSAATDLREQITRLGLDDAVILPGPVSHQHVTSYYSLMDLCIYPRLSMRLTEMVTPLKPLEAMSMGKIVFASDIGGHRELIEDQETGYLFEAGSPQALADKLLPVLQRPGRALSVAEAALRFVTRERTWQRSVSGYVPVYESLMRA